MTACSAGWMRRLDSITVYRYAGAVFTNTLLETRKYVYDSAACVVHECKDDGNEQEGLNCEHDGYVLPRPTG
jgi:hypothetical protein